MRVRRLLSIAVFASLFLALAHHAESQEGKEYIPQNKRFKIMMPPGNKSGQRTQIITIGKSKVPIESTYSLVNNGPTFSAASIGIPAKVIVGIPPDQRFDTLRDAIVKGMGGKVVDERELKQGMISGRDYQIEGKNMARMQMYMQGGFVFLAVVEAKNKDDVKSKKADDFFASFMMTPEAAEAKAGSGDVAKGGATRILGGAFDPEFKDEAPDGSLLVGFELGLGKFVNNDTIKAIRPIYRNAKGEEVMGKQFGTKLDRVVSVKAKPGYAVGAISVRAGLGMDAVTVTFMKWGDGKLDPSDFYKSDPVGGKGGTETVLNGAGVPVVGIVGKSNKEDATGIGLLFKK